ncbi:hypothetical protein MKZ26_03270 [Sporosarcina sp. FSL K6-6792]|uniref:hypothetical protein n=1 Tax=Sporosarcina sp. FSL K6-6792 TaxID=2921559 RepID=UPI0030FCFD48
MNYKILLANGDKVIERRINGVGNFVVEDGVYILYDRAGDLAFSAPLDSVICISAV